MSNNPPEPIVVNTTVSTSTLIIPYFIPIITFTIIISIYFLNYLPYTPKKYDFKIKFYGGTLVGLIASYYILTKMKYDNLVVLFGFILTAFIIGFYYYMNFNSYSLKNAQKFVNISELVYDLRNHPELVDKKRIDALSDDIEKLTRKSLKHYIIKKIKKEMPNYVFDREDFTNHSNNICDC